MDFYERADRQDAVGQAEKDGRVADSLDVRMSLLERVSKGEITINEAKKQLEQIKQKAKSIGKITRNQAWKGY